ncbi:MAG: Hsp20/alpha crystallin family protein [Candidatus Diapherotrites archaeon]
MDFEKDKNEKNKQTVPEKSFDIYFDFGKFEELVDKMMSELLSEGEPVSTDGKPIVMGFTMKIGPDGNAHVESFGNVRQKQKGVMVADVREPLTDVVDSGSELTITAELPGVEMKDVSLAFEGEKLKISAGKPPAFSKEISFPCAVLPETMRAGMKNGILEAVVRKA